VPSTPSTEKDLAGALSRDGDAEEAVQLRTDEPQEFVAGSEVSLVFPTLLAFRVESGSEESAAALQSLRENQEELARLLARYEVDTPEELQDRDTRRQTLERKLDNAATQRRSLPFEGDIPRIEAELRELRRKREHLEQDLESAESYEEWRELSMEVIGELLSERTERRQKLTGDIKELEAKLDEATDAVEELESNDRELAQKIALLEHDARNHEAQLDRLREADDYESMEERQSALGELATEVQLREQAWNTMEKEKKAREDDPKQQHEAAEKRVKGLQEQLHKRELDEARKREPEVRACANTRATSRLQ